MDIAEACRRNSEQASMAEVARLEKEKLLEDNKVISCWVISSVFVCTVWVCIDRFFYSVSQKLNDEIERLQMMMCELSSGVNVSNTQQHQDPLNPAPVSLINTQQQPQSESFLYEDIRGPFGGFLSFKKNQIQTFWNLN